ncbi:MAG: magnesium/cobalt transporter CorA [Dehalococcoidia bacterium]|nr:magnesium/cobalt transporter CorA [Dehalococcoidia bacterium]
MPFEAYYLSPENDLKYHLSETDVKSIFESKQGLLWVDISATTPEDGEFLKRTFDFHHLAIENCVDPRIFPPKVDDFGDYLFVIVHGINHAAESDIVETAELEIFLGRHFVVSNHSAPLYSVESIKHLVEEADDRPMRKGADFLVHALIDTLVDNVLPTIDRMSDRAEEIEESVIQNPQPSILEAIMQLKRSTQRLHRVMALQRETIGRLSRGEFRIIAPEAQIFYRDIYDHMVRIEEWNQILRDRADNALSTYLSSVANRQNETMRVLSIVATIFMPLTLLAGIYGMNFEHMPELGVDWAYFAVIGFMGLAGMVALWFFWARTWLGRRRWQVTNVKPFKVDPHKIIGYAPAMDHIKRWQKDLLGN